MKDFKSKLSTICGIVAAVCGGIMTMPANGVAIPSWLSATSGSLLAISVGIIGYLTGKNPDGTKKTKTQLRKIANEKTVEVANSGDTTK